MSQRLASADLEGQVSSDSIIELPINGKIRRFRLEESPIMAPGLAARYPEIKTYRVQGIDNPYASGCLSMTPRGVPWYGHQPRRDLLHRPAGW